MSNFGLRGHETVVRLVGKRRKLTLSAISPPKSVSRDFKRETGAGEASGSVSIQTLASIHPDGVASEGKVGHINWVNCPICQKSIRGEVINTHLDVCLKGGVKEVKRKSRQLTMSQFGGTTCTAKLSDRNLSVGFQKIATDVKQEGFGSVKVEARVTFGRPEPSKANEILQLEVKETKGRPQPVVNPSHPESSSLARTRPRRLSRKDSQGTSDFHPLKEKPVKEEPVKEGPVKGEPVKEEPVDAVDQTNASVCLGRIPEDDAVLSEPYRQAEDSEQGTEKIADGCFEESISPLQESKCDCSCHSHVSPSTSDVKEDVGRDEAPLENHSRGLIGVTEGKGPRHVVGTEAGGSNGVHLTTTTPANDKLVGMLETKIVGLLETKIVGRRYNRGTVCKEGMKVAFVREPDNPKDPNAIKVVEYGHPSGLKLGHLPREISVHLSSLLDKGLLQVWGTVTSVPAPVFGAVPVQLFCESRVAFKEDFLKLDGAEESLQNLMDAAENSTSFQLPSAGSVSMYQQNFLYMLQTVLERNSHLFDAPEQTFLEKFSSLSDDAQRLFIRLYQRKGPWFRLSTVEYKDVGDVSSAAEDLLAAGYMDADDSPDEAPEAALRKRFEVLSVPELRQFVCTNFLKKKSEAAAAKRDALLNMAVTAGMQKHGNLFPEEPESPLQSGSTLMQLLTESAGKCVRVSDMADFLLWRLKRLFFLNGDTELSAFLVVDLGILKYPRYRCWREQNIFDTRAALLAYEQALEVAQGMDMALESNNTVTALKLLERARHQMCLDDSNLAPATRTPTFLARFSSSYVYRNVCTLGVSILERERRYPESVDLLRQLLASKTIKSGRWGYWTVRLSMDLDHLGRKEESLQVAEEGVSDPWIRGGDLVALQRRVVRLGKPPRRWKTPPYAAALKKNCKEVQIQGRPLNCVTGMRSWFYGYDGQQCRVEDLALQYFGSEEGGGWQGVHCEGGVWMTFFGLLMWDVLFADVPDVFQTPFQTYPLDLDTEVFYPARKRLIEAHLLAIRDGDIMSLLAKTWIQHKGTLCRGVNWDRHSLEELQTIAICVGGSGLSTICRLLAEDYAGWTGGMPDLLLWRITTSSEEERVKDVDTDPQPCTRCACHKLDNVQLNRDGDCKTAREMGTSGQFIHGEDRDSSGCGSGEDFGTPRRCIRIRQTHRDEKRGEAKLVEVKGPRDRLSEQQRAWIYMLMNAGVDVEVCKVLEDAVE